jgi:hypothetical protein
LENKADPVNPGFKRQIHARSVGDSELASIESPFIKKNVRRLLGRYALSYIKEGNCIEYFITDKGTEKQISYSIVFSLDIHSKHIHISHFCPELFKQIDSRYLSAACFYLLIHHFGNVFHLDKTYGISLETIPATYDRFFSKLKDFDLRNGGFILCKTVAVVGEYPPLDINTSMIEKRSLPSEETPFQGSFQ